MKNTKQLMVNLTILLIVFVAVMLVFVFTACDNGNTDPCASGHTFPEWTAPTCTVDGNSIRTCTKCTQTDTRTEGYAKLDHDWEYRAGAIPSTCGAEGSGSRDCKREGCGHFELDVVFEIDPTAHDWDFEESDTEWEEVTAAKCEVAGLEKRTCQNTGCSVDTETRPITALVHQWDQISGIPSTCTTHGNGRRQCELQECQEIEDTDQLGLDPTNHVFNENKWTETTAPTCTTPATDTQKCDYDSCNALHPSNTRTGRGAVAENHVFNQDKWTLDTTPATCTTSATDTQKCDYDSCNALHPSNTRTGRNALVHEWTGWKAIIPQTPCIQIEACANCNEQKPEGNTRHVDEGCTGTQGLIIISNVVNHNSTLNVSHVCIPDTATSIADQAFMGNRNIVSVRIGKNVTSIDNGLNGAFRGCSNLETVTFAEGSKLETIGRNVFSYSGLTSIKIPASVISIGEEAFFVCQNLKTVTFAEGSQLQTIGRSAFSNSGLTSIEIPASVTSTGHSVFTYCQNLKTVTFAAGTQLQTIGNGMFWNSGLTSITIPESVTSIDGGAFGNTSLTSITIPAGVTIIGGGAFNSTSLTSIIVDANNPNYSSDDNGILYNKAKTTIIGVPKGIIGNITLPASLESIVDSAFYDCASLTGITIPASVTIIEGWAFQDCTSLATVTFELGSQLQTIGDGTFFNCPSLTSITIPASVTSISDWAFIECTSLEIVTVLATTPPELGEGVFHRDWDLNIIEGLTIFVPAESLNDYKTAPNWSEYADIIQAIE